MRLVHSSKRRGQRASWLYFASALRVAERAASRRALVRMHYLLTSEPARAEGK